MRLIDADELKKYSYRTDWNVPVVDVSDIDNAPSVELDESVIQEVLNKMSKQGDFTEKRCGMTNAEKYQEVFGFKPDTGNCPTEDCNQCPCKLIDNKGNLACVGISVSDWWNSEYKGVTNG